MANKSVQLPPLGNNNTQLANNATRVGKSAELVRNSSGVSVRPTSGQQWPRMK